MTWSVGARAAPLTPLPHWPAAQPAPNAAGGTLLPVASASAFACISLLLFSVTATDFAFVAA